MAAPKLQDRTPDWPYVTRMLRTTNLSIRAIAREVGVTEGAVRAHMKREGIQRDLVPEVRAEVRNSRVKMHAARQGKDPATLSREELVAAAAAVAAETLERHDKVLVNLRDETEGMLVELKNQRNLKDADRMPLAQRADVLHKLSATAQRMVDMERKALLEEGKGSSYEELLAELASE